MKNSLCFALCTVCYFLAACNDSSSDDVQGSSSADSTETTSSSSSASASDSSSDETSTMTGSTSGSIGDSTAETASSSEVTQDSSTGSSSEAALCGDLVDGALVEFSVHVSTLEHPDATETLKLWLSDDAFIDEALRLFESQEQRVPLFEGLLDGQDCDSQWTWHVNAATARWLEPGEIPGGGGDEIPTDSCDGLPSAVEAQKAYWFEQVRRYCPQDAKVLSIDDRRQR